MTPAGWDGSPGGYPVGVDLAIAWTILGVVIVGFIGMVTISRGDTNAIRAEIGQLDTKIDTLGSDLRTDLGARIDKVDTKVDKLGADLRIEMGQMRIELGGRIDNVATLVDHVTERVEEQLRTHAGT